MKKTVAILALAGLLISCSKNKTSQETSISNSMLEEPTEQIKETTEALTPIEQGKKLVESMDCLSCHKVDTKIIGPSYQDIAAKYTQADTDQLAEKIIKGSQGVWGDVPMSPHTGLSKANAQLMVQYILAQKK